jgi:hypothetical protein
MLEAIVRISLLNGVVRWGGESTAAFSGGDLTSTVAAENLR